MQRTSSWKRTLFRWLGITNEPTVKVYHGYGRPDLLIIQGHVLNISPLKFTTTRRNVLANTFALLRLFITRSYSNATVQLLGQITDAPIQVRTDKDGFFRLQYTPDIPFPPGWHQLDVALMTGPTPNDTILASGIGQVYVPHPTQYACVSDIDDTFLISHSATVLKRLKVLLTQNAYSRQPFKDVVRHYQLLAYAGTEQHAPNAFFYVSSSEWNLYEYIMTFSRENGLPKGIYLLNQLKRLHQVLKSGQNKHTTKFTRIARLLEIYPHLKFILLGDDTQEDPAIYASLVGHFPNQIICVYLRRVHAAHQAQTQTFIDQIEAAGVSCCYFTHSDEAIRHSQQIGLVAAN
ncbi:App1 family protein [Fibrisoma limi]|nr:App1 family protein [Fibrisoma limi]